MQEWRFRAVSATKYDPAKRNELGHYTDFEEWISWSDIGLRKDAAGQLLTKAEYLRVEQQYIDAVLLLFQMTQSTRYTIIELYKFSERKRFFKKTPLGGSDGFLYPLYERLRNYKRESLVALPDVVRLALREYTQLTIRFKGKYQSTVYFGYDYYMYFVTDFDLKKYKAAFERTGLYLEI